jgi:hypothetical protein
MRNISKTGFLVVEKRLDVKQKFITDLQNWYKAEAHGIDVADPDAVKIVNN